MARLALPIDECVLGRTTDTEFLKATEAALADQDYKVEQAKEKKNTLESYVYETRNKVELRISMFLLLLTCCILVEASLISYYT